MRIFGIGLVTLIMILAVGYMVGVTFPGVGQSLKAKLGV